MLVRGYHAGCVRVTDRKSRLFFPILWWFRHFFCVLSRVILLLTNFFWPVAVKHPVGKENYLPKVEIARTGRWT